MQVQNLYRIKHLRAYTLFIAEIKKNRKGFALSLWLDGFQSSLAPELG